MDKSLAKTLLVSATVLGLCGSVGTVITPMAMLNGQNTNIVQADQVAPSQTNIVIHKKMYDTKDAKYFEDHKLKNDGTEKTDLPGTLSSYDHKKMGQVEFTLYDITDVINKKYTDGKGLTGYSTSDADKKAQAGRVAKITKSIQTSYNKAYDKTHGVDPAKLKAEMKNNEFLKDAKVVATQGINDQGDVTFSNVAAYDASKPQKYHYYAAVETKSPQGFVLPPSEPLVFVNPYTNPSGTGFLSTMHLYPKNHVQTLTFKLNKQVLWNEDHKATETDGKDSEKGTTKKEPLAGAQFQLYKGKPGEGTKVGDVLTVDKDGNIEAKNLIMGEYYFVEVPSDVANDNPEDQQKASISAVAKNDKNNKLTFSITENGIDPSKLKGSLVDYGKPGVLKKLTNGVGKSQSLHRGDHANFDSKVTVPQNIMGSDWQMEVDGTEAKSAPYHVFYTRDEPQANLKDVVGERHLKITTPDGKKLEEGKDYQVLNGKNKWFVNFIVKDLSDQDKQTLEAAAKSNDNETIQKAVKSLKSGSVSDTVAKVAGKQLTYNYDEIVETDTPLDKDVVNDIYLGWDDGSGYQELKRSDKTITFGVHFVKESSGFLGTGMASQKLQGAKFAVQDERTKKWFNGFADDKKTGEKTAQWVDDYQDVKEGILTSDKEGKFALQGFTEGKYKLREIKAPAGYQLMKETMSFEIGPNTDEKTLKSPIEVKNDEKTSMPLTGSQRLLVVIIGGVVVVTVFGFVGYKFAKQE